ncbi:hypothetical protein SASPL_143167 [Salvia splendens]|uniref:Uncharacterized protein n=1 Tax=Salvia splendens TaxID=180675 RepID=A0A8X8WNB3_SALSN|nr:hypothetical protein SASPL_143167 [Salvia splendens]
MNSKLWSIFINAYSNSKHSFKIIFSARDINSFDLRLLGHGHGQHPILHTRLNLISLSVLREAEAPEELARAPLDAVPGVILLLLLTAALAADLEDIPFLHLYLDLLLPEAGHVGLEHVGLRCLLPVHASRSELRRLVAKSRKGSHRSREKGSELQRPKKLGMSDIAIGD